MRDKLAESARLRFLCAGSLIASLFLLSFFAVCVQLAEIVDDAATDDARIDNARLLGEMSDRLTELRLSQALVLLAPNERSRAAAAALAAEHRRVLAQSAATLVDATPRTLATRTYAAVRAYVRAEREWEQALDGSPATRAGFESNTKTAYETADRSVDAFIQATSDAAHRQSRSIASRSRLLLVVVMTIGALVCGVTLLAVRRLNAVVFRPLERITAALGQLSSGQRGISFPLLGRKDEIGRLAKAFQHFRNSADALREAYAATKLAEESAARLARHDSLTGLFNRRSLSAHIDEIAARAAQNPRVRFYLYVIDLDRFKPVNDLHGHAAGDAVLCEIASRLCALVRDDDVVARLGGDEFAALVRIESDAADNDAALLAARMHDAICAPLQIDHYQLEVGGSIGAALLGRDGCSGDALIRSADAAMYCAKDRTGSGIRFFEESMRSALRTRAELEIDVRAAVGSDSIEPYYQPLVDLRDDRIYGFEVLARWTHPQRGPVAPDVFIPVIERLGLATPFTLSMLRRACRDARYWPADVSIAVNLSPRQLTDPVLPAQIVGVLLDESFAPARLEVEMTETALAGDLDAAKATIDSFRRLGIRVSLDDFGTGYSSLHHLHELRFDTIKIDRSFVRSMLSDTESGKIVDAILDLSAKLGLSTLAEGIETSELRNELRARGCRFGQGYYFGKAMSAHDVPALFKRGAHAVATTETPHSTDDLGGA